MTKFPRTLLATVCLLALAAYPAGLQAQDGAKLAPADAGLFVQVDGLAKWRTQLNDDAIWAVLRPHLPDPEDNPVWQNIQTALGMTGPDLFDHFFGKSVVLIVSEVGDHKPGVIFSRIDKADGQLAIERLQLQPTDTFGAFKCYTTPDGNGHFAFSDEWMAMCDTQAETFAMSVLKRIGSGKSLADDAGFKSWTGKLPAQRDATVFARVPLPAGADQAADQPARLTQHALSLTRSGKDLSVHYAGEAGAFLSKLGTLGPVTTVDFGPLPASVCGAVSLNFFNHNPADVERLKALLPAKDLGKDVLSKLSGPIVLGVATPTGNPGADPAAAPPPALALAVRMGDRSVAQDLGGMVNTLAVLANIKGQEWKAPLIKISAAHHGQVNYQTANLGAFLASRGRRPEMASIELCFGSVGDWYLLTTSRAFFDQCVDAAAGNPGARLAQAADLKPLTLADTSNPIAALVVRGPDLATQLRNLAPKMQARHEQRALVMETLAGILDDAATVGVRLWQGQGEEVGGQLDLYRKQAP